MRDILPLRRRKSGTAIFRDAPGNAVTFIGLRIRQYEERRFQCRQQIADFANVLDRNSRRRRVTENHRYKRPEQLELSLVESRFEYGRIGGKKSVWPQFGTAVSRPHHFVQHLLVRLVPRWPGIIEHAPAIGRAGKMKA